MMAARFRSGPGVSWLEGSGDPVRPTQGRPAPFKNDLIRDMRDKIYMSFTPEGWIGKGRIGCADVGMSDTIHAGKSIRKRAQWDGMAHLRLGLPPSGPVTLHVFAGYYARGRNPPSPIKDGAVAFEGDARIVDGKDPSWLDPPEIIDAALRDVISLIGSPPRPSGTA